MLRRPGAEYCALDALPEDVHALVLDFIEADDLVCLADADLNCSLGREAGAIRALLVVRRAVIRSCAWLDFDDLGRLTAAWLDVDPVISRQVQFHVRERLSGTEESRVGRRRRTGDRPWALPPPGA